MNKKYPYGVFIGRFQPFHSGHAAVVEKALQSVDKLIILIGSSNNDRRVRNPFTFDERSEMIRIAFDHSVETGRIVCLALDDYTYQDQLWVRQVHDIVENFITDDIGWTNKFPPIALCGSQKDSTGYYLKMFPRWDSIPCDHVHPINATDIREDYYENPVRYTQLDANPDGMDRDVSLYVNELFRTEDKLRYLIDEYNFSKNYKQQFAASPYPVIHTTTDALVIQSGYALIVKRGMMPGKGQDAWPGGYLDPYETIIKGTIRELREETNIDVTTNYLMANHRTTRVFDDPHRSSRGRVITHASLFILPDGPLPRIKAGDDAKKVLWKPLSQIKPNTMFEDHGMILNAMLATGV